MVFAESILLLAVTTSSSGVMHVDNDLIARFYELNVNESNVYA